MTTGKFLTSLAATFLLSFSMGSTLIADDGVDLKNAQYSGDQTGGSVTAIGKADKSIITKGGSVTAVVTYSVEQTVLDATNTEVLKTEEVQLDVLVNLVPRYNIKKKLIGYDFNLASDPIAPVSLVGMDETAVSDPIISTVKLDVSAYLNNTLVDSDDETLFDIYDTDDDDDDDDDDDH